MVVNKFGTLLKMRGISLLAYAERAQLSRQWVCELCKEEKSISTRTLNEMCEILHCRVEEIIEYIPDVLWPQVKVARAAEAAKRSFRVQSNPDLPRRSRDGGRALRRDP